MEEVPRRTSLAPLAFLLCLIGVETEELLDYQERAGIISIVRWNPRPAELSEFAAELSPFSLPKEHSRNNIPPVSPFSASKIVILFSEVVFKGPPKRPFKTSTKLTSRACLYIFEVICLPREVVFKK